MKHPKHAKPHPIRSRLLRAASLFLAAVCLTVGMGGAMPQASAASMSDLQQRLEQIQQQMAQHKADLADAKKKAEAAAALEADLREQVNILQGQIAVLKSEIAQVQNNIGEKEMQIDAKTNEIAIQEENIEDQWSDFKVHMAAMQELREGGTVAMLSAVTDLYQLLTFSEVMQDISVRDTEILTEMRDAKAALEAARQELEEEKAVLVSQKNQLDANNAQMQAKQLELNASLAEAQLSAEEAQQAQQQAQEALDSDEMNYEAVQKEIQKIIEAAAQSQGSMSFTGFICPLKTYSRISSEYGYRVNPVTGVYKLHGGIDFAAAGGTPIYAAASGYVSVAGWSTGGYGNYVILYHGSMNDGASYSTLYGHMRSIVAKQGTYVTQGELIGYVGTTGNSTGNHLHLEVWQGRSNASRVNPRDYVPIPHN